MNFTLCIALFCSLSLSEQTSLIQPSALKAMQIAEKVFDREYAQSSGGERHEIVAILRKPFFRHYISTQMNDTEIQRINRLMVSKKNVWLIHIRPVDLSGVGGDVFFLLDLNSEKILFQCRYK